MDNKKLTKQIIKDYSKTFTDLGEYDKKSNKEFPVFSGLIKYFPNALRQISNLSLVSNNIHNKGEPLHWAREKSSDHLDAMMRHLIEYAKGNEFDDDGQGHIIKVCWRALAQAQIDIEKDGDI
jgi:hypothetical protein